MDNKKNQRAIGKVRYFSKEFKTQKVREIEQNIIKISDLCRLYNVSRTSVYKWMYKYSDNLKKGVKQVIEMESETMKSKHQQIRIAELERILGQKQLEIDYLSKVIEEFSTEIGEDIKKKFDTKSSTGSRMKTGGTK